MTFVLIGAQVIFEKISVIFDEYPKEGCKTISYKSQVMLRLVDILVFSMRRESDEFCYLKIFIMLVDIGVGMMDDIVGYLPLAPNKSKE